MLSPNVKDFLEEAQGNLKSALSHAARSEKPIINKQIAEVMTAIDYLMKTEEMTDKIEDMMKKDNNFFGDLF